MAAVQHEAYPSHPGALSGTGTLLVVGYDRLCPDCAPSLERLSHCSRLGSSLCATTVLNEVDQDARLTLSVCLCTRDHGRRVRVSSESACRQGLCTV